MRVIITLALICVSLSAVYAACGPDGVDMSAFNRQTDFVGKDDKQYDYYMNVCGPSNTPNCAAGICQMADRMYKFGNWGGAQWSFIDGDKAKGVKAYLGDAEGCWVGGQEQARPVTVYFPCDQSDEGTFHIVESPTCTFSMTMKTRLSCPGGSSPSGGSSGGLSGGWVFIIILLVVIPVYIVIGCIYKTKKLGTSGKESCPNWDFWSSIPGLVKDGFRFTIGGCKRGGTYNQL